jgi:dynactin 1
MSQPQLSLGARVIAQGHKGTVKFIGTTQFSSGKWVGVEYDQPLGKNSGIVDKQVYFECRPNHGVFVRPNLVKVSPYKGGNVCLGAPR